VQIGREASGLHPEGADLLRHLRGDGAPRPVVDPGLSGGLREWLEDGLAGVVGSGPTGAHPVRVNKNSLNQVLVCEAHLMAGRSTPRAVTVELARGSMVDALFRQWITTGTIDDPWDDAIAALEVEGDRDGVVQFAAGLERRRRRALAAEVAEHAAMLRARWPVLSPAWLARTQERIEIPLCGGRVVLAGVLDLVLGAPAHDRASICLVELKSGARRIEHRGDLRFYALLETLRSGSPPFRTATYYSASGELDADAVDEDALVSALHRTLEGATRLCRLSSGAEPARTPNPLCAWCAALASCPPGRAHVASAEASGSRSKVRA
jgi:hypothetical protein